MAISLLEQSVLIKLVLTHWTNSTNAVALHQLKIRHFGLEKMNVTVTGQSNPLIKHL